MQTRVSYSVFNYCKSSCVYIEGKGSGWWSGAASGVNNPGFYNCQFRNSTYGVLVHIEGGGVSFGGTSYIGRGGANPEVRNCIFDSLSDTAISFVVGSYPASSKPIMINNAINNCNVGLSTVDPFDVSLYNSIISDCKTAVKRTGTLSGQIGFTCLFNNMTNFVGYPSAYGKLALQNQNGTPSDVAMNIFVNPSFAETVNFTLSSTSPCIDAGDATAAYNYKNFPPSLGTVVNDMGAYGGPNAIALDDADADGLPDSWELKYFGSISKHGPQDDPDGDGLANIDEFKVGTDPMKADTDGDGYTDLAEIDAGTDPLDPKSTPPPVLLMSVEQVRLQFTAGMGQINIIETSNDLKSWQPTEQLIGNGGMMSRVYSVTNGYRYFRLQRP